MLISLFNVLSKFFSLLRFVLSTCFYVNHMNRICKKDSFSDIKDVVNGIGFSELINFMQFALTIAYFVLWRKMGDDELAIALQINLVVYALIFLIRVIYYCSNKKRYKIYLEFREIMFEYDEIIHAKACSHILQYMEKHDNVNFWDEEKRLEKMFWNKVNELKEN